MAAFSADSFLMHIPANLPPRDRVWLEAVGFSVSIADLTYERLKALLLHVADAGQFAAGDATLPLALADAWAFVDSAHRLSDMINRGAGDLRTPDLGRLGRDFVAISRAVLDLRNSVQHVGHEEMERVQASGIPVWGTLSWAVVMSGTTVRMCSLAPGGGGQKVEHRLVNPAGHTFLGRIDHIHLEAFAIRASLSDSHRALVTYARELEQGLATRFAGHPREFPGVLMVMEAAIAMTAIGVSGGEPPPETP